MCLFRFNIINILLLINISCINEKNEIEVYTGEVEVIDFEEIIDVLYEIDLSDINVNGNIKDISFSENGIYIINSDSENNSIIEYNIHENKYRYIYISNDDFIDPKFILSLNESIVIIYEQIGNSYFVEYSMDGDIKSKFDIISNGPIVGAIYKNGYIYITTIAECENPDFEASNSCIVQIYDINDGSMISSTLPTNMIQADAKGVPFYFSIDPSGNMYAVHVYGNNITIINDESITKFSISVSPGFSNPSYDALPNDVYELFKYLNNNSYSFIEGLFVIGEYIIIQYSERGQNIEYLNSYYIDVFDQNGNLISYGYKLNGRIFDINNYKLLTYENDIISIYGLNK